MREGGERGRGRGREPVALAVALLLLSPSLVPAQRPLRPVRPFTSTVRPGQALPPVVKRALTAAGTLRYTGRRIVTVLRDGQPDRHEEIVMRDGPRMRIEFPSEGAYAGQVIVEDPSERRHFLPESNEVRVLPTRREEGLQRLRALVRTGGVTTSPGDRIAGLPTVEVFVRDAAGNPIQRLSIEPESGMVLRRRVYDATGVEVGGFVFTRIDLSPGAFDPAIFRIERKGVTTTTPLDALRRLARKSGYAAVSLPESTGFRLEGVRVARLPEGDVLVQTYLGTGGRLSLYQLRAAVSPDRLRRQGARRLNALSWAEGGATFVLLGPQDDATLARLRKSLGL